VIANEPIGGTLTYVIPTFRQFVTELDVPAGGAPAPTPGAAAHPVTAWLAGRTVTDVDYLWQSYDEFVFSKTEAMKSDPQRPWTDSQPCDLLAEDIIVGHFGAPWYEAHVTNAATSKLSKGFLGGVDQPLSTVLYIHRVRELARRLYQLQSFAWFETYLDKLRTNGRKPACHPPGPGAPARHAGSRRLSSRSSSDATRRRRRSGASTRCRSNMDVNRLRALRSGCSSVRSAVK